MSKETYADIIIPGALTDSYTYLVEEDLVNLVKPGSRVIVPFGKSRKVIGIVEKLHIQKPDIKGIKRIISVPGYVDSVSPLQLKLWRWISEYYMCTMGEVMDAALPAGLKLDNRNKTGEQAKVPDQKYKPRLKPFVRLKGGYSEEKAGRILDKLGRAYAQRSLLETYLTLISFGESDEHFVESDLLVKESTVSHYILTLMVNKGYFEKQERERPELIDDEATLEEPLLLNGDQETAIGSIREGLKDNIPVLLKGVTSSGKTEIYVHLINEQIKRGKQVLYLLPEIALTTQIISRLRKYFGNSVGVYHSKFSDNERVEVWRRTSGSSPAPQYRLILGVRSSVFLPFENLGLIIVDEEHDQSYKQKDPSPRYNARDCALVLASMHKAGVLLGSATPSIDTYFNAREGRYRLVELNSRHGDVKMPEIEIADTREALRRKVMISHFTPALVHATEETLGRGEQVLFFRNRRGYAPVLLCHECGWTPLCNDCSVSMTYHKGVNHLRCHYCGNSSTLPKKCGNCGSSDIRMKGFGTEKIEDEISILFPEAKVARMDLDTTRNKGAIDRLIGSLEKGETDIMVGTQMISKGLDFENLTLIGILNIDSMMLFPDFRAAERCFQMIEQVSGRAGRRKKQGKVIIQTADPTSKTIRLALHHDYINMFKSELSERKEFGYPPFTRLIKVYIKHPDRSLLLVAARNLASTLRENLKVKVLGPEEPPVGKIQKQHLQTVMIKVERDDKELKRIKEYIRKAIDYTITITGSSSLRVYADVDPV